MLLSLALVACATHIPQPTDITTTDSDSGRSVLEWSAAHHGGLTAWRAVDDLQVQLHDDWPGVFPSALAPPYPHLPQDMTLTYNYQLDKGTLAFGDATRTIWGHDSVEGWVSEYGRRTYQDVPEATFQVPTFAYFLALPFKFLDDGALIYAMPPALIAGRPVEQVLVTFEDGVGTVQDRYLVSVDARTGELVHIALTVADNGDGVEVDAWYEDWEVVDGLKLPTRIRIGLLRPLSLELLHVFTMSDYDLTVEVNPASYEKPQ